MVELDGVKDVKETLKQVTQILQVMSKKENSGHKIKCLPPQNPELVVGMDEPFSSLKMELLKDGTSALGLTGLPGSGKTTLATKLCADDRVKGKFRDHILFVTVSKTPNFKVIVEALLQSCGSRVPKVHSDKEAVKELRLLFSKMAERPILLVLDDVWSGSESLVQNFKFQIPDYKILITSRAAIPTVNPQIRLGSLRDEDALTLFRHFALVKDNSSFIPDENLVQEVVRSCKGLPLAIKIIAESLCQEPYDTWQKMVKELSQGHSILDSNTSLLKFLQGSLNVLEDEPIIMECFMDLGLFPEDQKIPVTALIDMWAELYGFDDDGKMAMTIINKLVSLNLANLLVTREAKSDSDNYSNYFIVQHGLLRELAIHQSNQEPFERRRRLMIDINENNRQWCLEEQQQNIIFRLLSAFLEWCARQKQQPAIARIMSISTDETIASDWGSSQLMETEVLLLNDVHTKQHSLPKFTEKMISLKVLTCTNYGFHASELENFEILGFLSNLRRIRLEKVSVPPLGTLKSLQKLSLCMCDTSQAFGSSKIPISDSLPILVELNIDYCKDMVELPSGLCDIKTLKKLSISNCHKFSTLPQEIGRLENLEVLRLNSCTDLGAIPDSIGELSKLRVLDISNCISLRNLPEGIGSLRSIEKLYMTGCSRCELPDSVLHLDHFVSVTCDEETAVSWEAFRRALTNLRIEVPDEDVNLNWLLGSAQ
ncbi:probable disease resistance protein At5g66900 [Prosopis cineraria]|uniref:probable disease resistance protein At5g66900 n=1 Tax=Prosopis cineraria TaxID=364024 RepID=UPI00240F208E|nr:probable disease resistance protein At5g66900 [Prosopis cineraria]XP_054776859.1 probable disease resistance protein At5g66900 [Prosopis cineraria]XP_054776860.1 probable disease resistance protein At5g66900 [Prosopis cineraria]XP_054776861.1 probable disease resistance protein At5g66900 [Prosopis cineraria]XP_054776862.1 probable disease resistance protein At5g66900 [Prosopis cineraria]